MSTAAISTGHPFGGPTRGLHTITPHTIVNPEYKISKMIFLSEHTGVDGFGCDNNPLLTQGITCYEYVSSEFQWLHTAGAMAIGRTSNVHIAYTRPMPAASRPILFHLTNQ